MTRHEQSCPLCGARLSASAVLATCDEVLDDELGVFAGHCPFCQGCLELRPGDGVLELGYRHHGRFDKVVTLPAEGLRRARDGDTWTLSLNGRSWTIVAGE